MDLGLEGKVAWVLGGSSGLGRAAAESLAREGASVAISARRGDVLDRVASEIGDRCIAVRCDVSDADHVAHAHEEVVAQVGDVDILVANSGGPPPGPFVGIDEETVYGAFENTTMSAWRTCKAVVPAMQQRGSGVLLFITSSSTKEILPALLLSNMMRAAVVGFAKTLSKELGPHGIRTVCLAPGTFDTPRIEQLEQANVARTGRSLEEIRAEGVKEIPVGRYGKPQEFGDLVAFCASERASYLTGVTIVEDGGRLYSVLS
ncbi:MAG: SDR family oxidoreductase [Actinomycetota bacterium]|nr:SDR family oxidoreductase [Actinomycetota bacterium]